MPNSCARRSSHPIAGLWHVSQASARQTEPTGTKSQSSEQGTETYLNQRNKYTIHELEATFTASTMALGRVYRYLREFVHQIFGWSTFTSCCSPPDTAWRRSPVYRTLNTYSTPKGKQTSLLSRASKSLNLCRKEALHSTRSQSFAMSWRLDICLVMHGRTRTAFNGTGFAPRFRTSWEKSSP